ncbi:peptidase M28 family protein [Pelomyxa schiedti]|nr:peptidase M28 family protein [Pelomyxa schiedti]
MSRGDGKQSYGRLEEFDGYGTSTDPDGKKKKHVRSRSSCCSRSDDKKSGVAAYLCSARCLWQTVGVGVIVVGVLVVVMAFVMAIVERGHNDELETLVESLQQDTTQYARMAALCDLYPARISSSPSMDAAIEWILDQLQLEGMEGYTENASVPYWYQNPDGHNLKLLYPGVPRELAVTPLGRSIGTGPDGIEGYVLVVSSFDELNNRSAEAAGKIVVYDVDYVSYGDTVQYRSQGALMAASVGALASLTMSVTPESLYTLHTGGSTEATVPAGSITVEDAKMLHRMQNRGQIPLLHLVLDCENRGTYMSRNVIIDIPGTDYPDEYVIISGHLDSWDMNMAGAHDDAGGTLAAWQVVRSMYRNSIRAKRTVRAILWTCEELGGYGGRSYAADHLSELDKTSLAVEMDLGVFEPKELSVSGGDKTLAALAPVAETLLDYGLNVTLTPGSGGVDTRAMEEEGVPCMSLIPSESIPADGVYYSYHHTRADTPEKVDMGDFNDCSTVMGIIAYVVANMDDLLPHDTTTNT